MAQEKGPVRSLRRPTDSYRRQWDYTSTPSSVADDVVVAEEDDESRCRCLCLPSYRIWRRGGCRPPLLPLLPQSPAAATSRLCRRHHCRCLLSRRIWRRGGRPPSHANASRLCRHHLPPPSLPPLLPLLLPPPPAAAAATSLSHRGGGREKRERERESVDSRWMDKNMQGSSCGSARFYKTGTYNIS